MNQRSIRQVLAALGAIVGSTLVACGGAPSEGESGDQSQAMCIRGQTCGCTRYVNGRCCPIGDDCPPNPPEPTYTTTWSYTSRASTMCQTGFAGLAAPNELITEYGVWSNASDPVKKMELALMSSYGCSTPIRWSTSRVGSTPERNSNGSCNPVDANTDRAYMHAQLCPASSALTSYVATLGYTSASSECSPADHPAHTSTAACDSKLPMAPAGYAWALLSIDPTCGASGCMVSSTGGPVSW